uniref:Uncharacterized protein n=1 Tax=viral metagenome TaxID=1070528 RepID=A0A6C0C5G2_9ZZZZ
MDIPCDCKTITIIIILALILLILMGILFYRVKNNVDENKCNCDAV